MIVCTPVLNLITKFMSSSSRAEELSVEQKHAEYLERREKRLNILKLLRSSVELAIFMDTRSDFSYEELQKSGMPHFELSYWYKRLSNFVNELNQQNIEYPAAKDLFKFLKDKMDLHSADSDDFEKLSSDDFKNLSIEMINK